MSLNKKIGFNKAENALNQISQWFFPHRNIKTDIEKYFLKKKGREKNIMLESIPALTFLLTAQPVN